MEFKADVFVTLILRRSKNIYVKICQMKSWKIRTKFLNLDINYFIVDTYEVWQESNEISKRSGNTAYTRIRD